MIPSLVLQVPYPEYKIGRAVIVNCHWMSEEKFNNERNKYSHYEILEYKPQERKILMPYGLKEFKTIVALDGGIGAIAVARVVEGSPGVAIVPIDTIRLECPEQYVLDEVFTCRCGVEATIGSIDARWSKGHGYWLCGPCRDHLEENGYEPDWERS